MKRVLKQIDALPTLIVVSVLAFSSGVVYGESNAEQTSKAKDALSKKDSDADSEKNLEEVFEASQKSFSLIKEGQWGLTYGFDHSYYRDARFAVVVIDGAIRQFDVNTDAQHTFSSTLSLDYGVWDNLTLSVRAPFIVKYETQKDIQTTALGDISGTLRWQPFPLTRGLPTTTLYATFNTKTGDSPYKVDPDQALSTGSGFYSMGFGVNASQVKDPVVLFGSLGYTHNFKESGLNQQRGGSNLLSVAPGDNLSLSMGMAYSLSYDISVSASLQYSYGLDTTFEFDTLSGAISEDTFSSIMNFSVGVRTSPKRIVNINVGFGLTEESADVLLGVSLPVDLEGLIDNGV